MKKVLSLTLALVMLLSLFSIPVFAADPDGSKENPYPVSRPIDVPTQIEVAAGGCVYYQFPALKFNGWNLSAMNATAIEVNGVMHTEISLGDRCIKITLSVDGDLVGFHNDTEETALIDLVLEQPVGTETDPYQLESGDNAISIPASYPTYYATYVPTVVGDYIVSASDYENFIITLDFDGDVNTTEDQMKLTQDVVFPCTSDYTYMPIFAMIQPIGNTPDIVLTITPPAPGTASNPYLLGNGEEVAAGANGLGDGLWPASPVGVCYTSYSLDGTTLVVEYDGTANLVINGTEYVVNGKLEIPMALTDGNWAFNIVITTATDSNVKLSVVYPEGTYENPIDLNKGKNTLSLPDTGSSVYAAYTAEKDGVLVITPNTVKGLGYTDASNLTTGDYDYIFAGYENDEGVIEGASEDMVLTIPVTKGDVVLISTCAGENEDFEILAMDLVLTVAYEGESTVEIVEQPKTATYGKEGATVKVTVKAKGEGLKYQWYIKNAGSTKYSKSSITSATYSVKLSASSSDRRLYCVITDAYGNEVRTDTVLVRRQATITKESATASYAKKGGTVKATVTAAGDGLKYTWYIKNDGATKYTKSSITKATYTATMSDKVKNRRVYCVVTDKYGKKVQSKTFMLRESVSITTQPKHTKVAMGKTAKITVKASGDGLKYTWYIRGEKATKYTKSSITKATYSAKMSKSVNGRRIYCIVTDKYGNKVQTITVKLSAK